MAVLRSSTLVLNSRDRDVATDPTNNFHISLARPVFNVVKAEMRYFFLENGIWNIDTFGNSFNLTIATVGTTTIFIPPGYYSQIALCNEIQKQCDDYSNGTISSVAITPSGTFELISSTKTFSITFTTGNFNQKATALLLGFPPDSTYNSAVVGGQNTIQSPSEVSIATYPYIFLQSSKLQNQLLTTTGLSAFAVVPMTSSLQGIGNTDVALGTTYDAGAYPMDASYFTQPITLDRIDIRLVDDTGALLDTRNNNVSIVLRLAHTV